MRKISTRFCATLLAAALLQNAIAVYAEDCAINPNDCNVAVITLKPPLPILTTASTAETQAARMAARAAQAAQIAHSPEPAAQGVMTQARGQDMSHQHGGIRGIGPQGAIRLGDGTIGPGEPDPFPIDPDGQEELISNSDETLDYPNVGFLVRNGNLASRTEARCTGVLVSPTHALTAAHCVPRSDEPAELYFYTHAHGMIAIKPDKRRFCDPPMGCGETRVDLALITLTKAIGPRALTDFATTAPSDNELATLVGFGAGFRRSQTGNTGELENSGLKRVGTAAITQCQPEDRLKICASSITVAEANSMFCRKDSGSPMFIGRANSRQLAGIAVLATSGGCGAQTGKFIDLTIPRIQHWIRHQLNLDNSELVEVPDDAILSVANVLRTERLQRSRSIGALSSAHLNSGLRLNINIENRPLTGNIFNEVALDLPGIENMRCKSLRGVIVSCIIPPQQPSTDAGDRQLVVEFRDEEFGMQVWIAPL